MATNISQHLKKPYWVRRIPAGEVRSARPQPDCNDYEYPLGSPQDGEQYLTQTDFANEINPEAHAVNSEYASRRPIYAADGETAKGKTKWKITGYEPMERVCLGYQKRIAEAKTAHFANFWVANETDKKDLFEALMSYKDSVGLDLAMVSVVQSCFKSGDGALYVYHRGNNIEYKVFSSLFGDTLFQDVDENRNPVIYRKYLLNGKVAVDIHSTKYVETWVQSLDGESESDGKWFNRVKGWFSNITTERSEDGWRLLSRTKAQAGADYNQCIYWRIPDIPSGVAQQSIDALERTCSFLAEEFKSTAIPILVLKAVKMNSLPPIGSHGKTIGIKGTADDLGKSDAKILTPPDASNIATITIDTLVDNIIRSTMSVFVEPDILKQGSDSSAAIKILYAPEVQWCKNMQPFFIQGLKDMLEVFKVLVAKVAYNGERFSDFADLRISCGFDVWLPQNESERIDNITKLFYAGLISGENARTEWGSQYPNDMEIAMREKEQKLYIETFVPIKAKAEAEKQFGVPVSEEVVVDETEDEVKNSATLGIDNNAENKSVATSKD